MRTLFWFSVVMGELLGIPVEWVTGERDGRWWVRNRRTRLRLSFNLVLVQTNVPKQAFLSIVIAHSSYRNNNEGGCPASASGASVV